MTGKIIPSLQSEMNQFWAQTSKDPKHTHTLRLFIFYFITVKHKIFPAQY